MAASIGLFVILLFTLFVANVLVQPLERMFDFSENIFGTKNRNIGDIEKDSVRNNPISRIFQLEKHQRNKWCKTELNTLKKEFQRMLLDFSDRKASKVATTEISEVQNDTSWKEEYSTIYSVDNLSFEKNGETEIFLDDQRQTELQFQMLRSDKYPLMKRLTTIGKSWRKKFPIKSNRRSANDVHNHSSINGNIDQIYDDGVDDGDDGGDEDDDNVDNHHKIKSRRKKLNRGKCTNRDNFSLEVTKTMQAVSLPGQFRILYSPLFLFIAALIALPNLFVLVFISIMFQENINRLHQLFNQIFLDPMNDQRKKKSFIQQLQHVQITHTKQYNKRKKFGMLLGRESVIFDLIYFKAIRILSVVKEYNLCKEAKDFGIEHLIQLAEDILINNWNKPLTNMERQAYQ